MQISTEGIKNNADLDCYVRPIFYFLEKKTVLFAPLQKDLQFSENITFKPEFEMNLSCVLKGYNYHH